MGRQHWQRWGSGLFRGLFFLNSLSPRFWASEQAICSTFYRMRLVERFLIYCGRVRMFPQFTCPPRRQPVSMESLHAIACFERHAVHRTRPRFAGPGRFATVCCRLIEGSISGIKLLSLRLMLLRDVIRRANFNTLVSTWNNANLSLAFKFPDTTSNFFRISLAESMPMLKVADLSIMIFVGHAVGLSSRIMHWRHRV